MSTLIRQTHAMTSIERCVSTIRSGRFLVKEAPKDTRENVQKTKDRREGKSKLVKSTTQSAPFVANTWQSLEFSSTSYLPSVTLSKYLGGARV
jgi:hypothetical protein